MSRVSIRKLIDVVTNIVARFAAPLSGRFGLWWWVVEGGAVPFGDQLKSPADEYFTAWSALNN